jgi:hypothetical protein
MCASGTERVLTASNPAWTTTNAKRSEPKGSTLTTRPIANCGDERATEVERADLLVVQRLSALDRMLARVVPDELYYSVSVTGTHPV